MAAKELGLKVAEAMRSDYGKRVARLDANARQLLGLSTGDIIEIKGKKSAAAIVLPSHPQDEGLNVIRMDGILRQNTGVGVGDRVKIRKAQIKNGKKVVLAPNQPMRYAPGFSDFVRKSLTGKPLNKGDLLNVNVFGSSFPFAVAQTVPSGLIVVTPQTEVVLKEEPVKELDKVATVTYEDIGGLSNEIQKIREMVELPMRHPELFERLGIEPPKGVLIYGTPGCGKTLLAKAVATESDTNFIVISGPEIVSKFVGEAEEKLRKIFQEAEDNAPSIIFIDEIDAIAPKREEVTGEVEKRIVSQLLVLMDGLKSRGQVVVLAATNRQNSIDAALRRPGRFDREIEIGVPDKKGRKEILEIHTRGMPLEGVFDPILTKQVVTALPSKKSFISLFSKFTGEHLRRSLLGLNDEENVAILNEITAQIKKLILGAMSRSNYTETFELDFRKKVEKTDSFDELVSLLNNMDYLEDRPAEQSKTRLLRNVVIPVVEDYIDLKEHLTSVSFFGLKPRIKVLIKNLELDESLKEYLLLRLSDASSTSDVALVFLGLLSKEQKELLRQKFIEAMIDELSGKTHGFVGADLQALTKESAMRALRRLLPKINLDAEEIPAHLLNELKVKRSDFYDALREIRPSALREVFVEVPNVKWDEIGGLEKVKLELKEAVELPLQNPEVFKRMGIRPTRGILLFGPPGCGKTLLAKAVATESEANFIAIRGPELISKWVGESEKGVREVFRKARLSSPCIIFFDEIDSIAVSRGGSQSSHVLERVVNSLLAEMDGLSNVKDVIVIGATNRPDILDPAILRPGRFDKIVEVSLPDEAARLQVLEVHTKGMPIAKDVLLKGLAKRTEGYSGADLEALCREAAMIALRKNLDAKSVKHEHFDAAFESIKPLLAQQKRVTEDKSYS